MPAAGARALLSASRSASSYRRSRLPRVAVASSLCCSCLIAQPCQPLGSPGPPHAYRDIWGSSRPPRPESSEPNGAGKDTAAAAPDSSSSSSSSKQSEKDAAVAEPDAPKASEATKESLRAQGYGSARARASRSRPEELPALNIPTWFNDKYVALDRRRKPAAIAVLEDSDLDTLSSVLNSELARHGLQERHIERFANICRRLSEDIFESSHELDRFIKETDRSGRQFQLYAMYSTLALAHNGPHAAESRSEFCRLHRWVNEDDVCHAWITASDDRLSDTAKRWLAHVYPAEDPKGHGAFHGSPLAGRSDDREWTIAKELVTTLRAELLAKSPESRTVKELHRPITVLSVMNYRGRLVAKSVVDDVAASLHADLVFLDASSISRIVGGYLGQTPYWSRGQISMLGYQSAELNGRQVPRSGELDQELEVFAVSSRLRALGKREFGLGAGSSDDRWDDLKLTQALEKLVRAADDRASASGHAPNDRLIVHIHDFVEINSLAENIVAKIRAVVDKMWQKGRKVIIVGSTSGDMKKSSQWQARIADIAREDCHIVPFHASEMDGAKDELEAMENWRENLVNIRTMVQALDPSFTAQYREEYNFEKVALSVPEMALAKRKGYLQSAPLAKTVYDVQWIYRYASLLLGSHASDSSRDIVMDVDRQEHVLSLMSTDKEWAELYPGAKTPYFSPFASSKRFTAMTDPDDGDWSSPPDDKLSEDKLPKDLNASEKALLSGLINAKDIHTSFDDIIVPSSTKDSLRALTSLSLIRPDAFAYGVLKTERIPGCLLYGPPGNGKTLLAKAVAKESGAHMLEVSAASVNDRWLGQSEKNVRAIFSLARKMAPMVIFLDEADALLSARSSAQQRPAHRETITQFLREWDGMSDMRAFIMVATNRPFDLDEAVLRRLPRRILVDLPLRNERESILRIVLRDETLAPDVDLSRLAAQTELYSGSDLKHLCVAAAMEAVREENRAKDAHHGPDEFVFPERRILTQSHFSTAARDISASISEDMESLKAIRKFDAQYGDAGRKTRKKRSMGFEVTPGREGSGAARVRQITGSKTSDESLSV